MCVETPSEDRCVTVKTACEGCGKLGPQKLENPFELLIIREPSGQRMAEHSLKDGLQTLVASSQKVTIGTSLLEPGSSKDTNTVDLRASSPRNSKSVGTTPREKLSGSSKFLENGDCSISSQSGHRKIELRAYEEIHGTMTGSEASHHSSLQPELDDPKEADSLCTLRSREAQQGADVDADACSGSNNAVDGEIGKEEIQSRSLSRERSTAEGGKGNLSDMDLTLFQLPQHGGNDEGQTEAEKGGSTCNKRTRADCGIEVSQGRGSGKKAALQIKVETGFKRAIAAEQIQVREAPEQGSAAKLGPAARCWSPIQAKEQQPPVPSPAHLLKPNPSSGTSLGDEEGEEDELTATPKKAHRKQRSKLAQRASTNRRYGRLALSSIEAANEAASDDEYLPPGEASEAAPASAARRSKTLRTRSSSGSKPPLASLASTPLSRGSGRLRLSSSIESPEMALTSQSASRRLRSQSLDLSCLLLEAFPTQLPPKRRGRCSALQAGAALLTLLHQQEQCRPLHRQVLSYQLRLKGERRNQLHSAAARAEFHCRSSSGSQKPRPAWQPMQVGLSERLESSLAGCEASRQKHSAHMKLLDGQPGGNYSLQAAASRLESRKLAGALQSPGIEEGESQREQVILESLCSPLVPPCLKLAADQWKERIKAPVHAVLCDAPDCCTAGRERTLLNSWEDLLARHALEAEFAEAFSKWL